jgi:hypothetical protein
MFEMYMFVHQFYGKIYYVLIYPNRRVGDNEYFNYPETEA